MVSPLSFLKICSLWLFLWDISLLQPVISTQILKHSQKIKILFPDGKGPVFYCDAFRSSKWFVFKAFNIFTSIALQLDELLHLQCSPAPVYTCSPRCHKSGVVAALLSLPQSLEDRSMCHQLSWMRTHVRALVASRIYKKNVPCSLAAFILGCFWWDSLCSSSLHSSPSIFPMVRSWLVQRVWKYISFAT